ncbi:DsbA family protein [Marinomonas agarivorans]|nr:DsbA family protein [Marinomonas agarivorans]
MTATLIYCYDPMCSWCWGFTPTWQALKSALAPLIDKKELTIQPMLGGLAVDSNAPMPLPMRDKLQATWQQISQQLGTEFNYDFWTECQPRRSTYPACRACLVARDQGLEEEMIEQIQHAYYLHAKNPSDLDTLTECAHKLGMKETGFLKAMEHVKATEQLELEVSQARQLGLNSFPSLAVIQGNRFIAIPLNYQDSAPMVAAIQQAISELSQ